MGTTRALVVGVSTTTLEDFDDLPFCKNDILAISKSLISGIGVLPQNVFVLGKTGLVDTQMFIKTTLDIASVAEDDDVFILYFSGHGTTKDNKHYLVFSNKLICTAEILQYLGTFRAKSKIVFLDCCYAGNFSINGSATFDINQTVADFAGKGYAVFAACNAEQFSFEHPDIPISVFTNYLCQALSDKLIIRKGKKSLSDIHNLLFFLLDIWNRNHPDIAQNPIYRANLGGTIYFEVADYKPYFQIPYYVETDKYIISSVDPLHNTIAKRYAIKVILKSHFSFSEIAEINKEIVHNTINIDIFKSQGQEIRWAGKPANIIICYYALDEGDIINNNYVCYTTWVDNKQDKSNWYKTGKGKEQINGVHFSISSYYETLKSFTLAHTATKEQIVAATNEIIKRMITLAEVIIALFNDFINAQITEEILLDGIATMIPELNKLYFEEGNLEYPPKELAEWCQQCSNLVATIHDFTLYYNRRFLADRTPENRKACMVNTIDRYYKELEALKAYE